VGKGALIIGVLRSHSAGLLWTSGNPVAKTSTWQHATLTRDRHACPLRNSNPES